ncbi:unnamed protein product, partial [Rangifer tarandus platyrhynchus]
VSLLLFSLDHSILQQPWILPELTAPAPTSGLGAVSPRQHRPVPGPMPPVPRMCVSVQAVLGCWRARAASRGARARARRAGWGTPERTASQA